MGFGWSLGFTPYNEWWKHSRKLFHRHFQPSAVPQFRPKKIKAAHGFLRKLIDSPERFHQHMQLYDYVSAPVLTRQLMVFDGQNGRQHDTRYRLWARHPYLR
jgi:cytochrome P450